MNGSRFIALGPLASGPTSRAFLGYETGAQGPAWPVVIIWVPDEVAEDPDRIQQLKEDTERAVQIDHPNVIRVLGCELLEEGWARVVEFADAENLRSVFSAAAGRVTEVPIPILNRVIADACAGVHHVHEMGQAEGSVRGRLHGALRPETLMVGFDGVTKVTGYGALAVAPRDVFGARLSPRLQYLSPEEIESGPGAADRRSDVYALGLTLYQGICGTVPFPIHEPEFEQKVLQGDLSLAPLTRAPPLLREVVQKALERQPANRFPTTKLMQQALESIGTADRAEAARFLALLLPEMNAERSDRRSLLTSVGFREPWPRAQARLRSRLRPKPRVEPTPAVTAPVARTPTPAPVQVTPTPLPTPAVAAPARPEPTTVAPAPAPPTPAPPVERPMRSAPAAVRPRSLTPVPLAPRHTPAWQIFAGGMVAVLAVIGMLALLKSSLNLKHLATTVTAAVGAGPSDDGPPPVEKPRLPAQAAVVVPPEPPPEPPPPPSPAVLELTSQPRLQVFVDGQPKGMTPLSVSVREGEHRLRFRDKAQGIDLGRTVYAHSGEHVKEGVHLSPAAMELSAPAGSQVTLDGRRMGTAPMGTLHFFEGHHTIRVVMGHAVFERQFDAQSGETLTLEVHPEAVR